MTSTNSAADEIFATLKKSVLGVLEQYEGQKVEVSIDKIQGTLADFLDPYCEKPQLEITRIENDGPCPTISFTWKNPTKFIVVPASVDESDDSNAVKDLPSS